MIDFFENSSPEHELCRRSALDRLRYQTLFDVDQQGERQVERDFEELKRRQRFPRFHAERRIRIMQSATWKDRPSGINFVFFNREFMDLAFNRMLIGAFRYGDFPKQKAERRPYAILDSMFERMALYDTEPNLEPLLDIFNLAAIEWDIDYTFNGEAVQERIEYTLGMGDSSIAHLAVMCFELEHYKITKNKTSLLDVANLAIAEWYALSRWGTASYFRSVDDGIHCNYTNGSWYDGHE